MTKPIKKIIGISLALLFFVHCEAYAIDGHFWESLSAGEKEAYIAGLIDGALSFGAEALYSVDDQAAQTAVDNLMDDYDLRKETPVSAVVNVLDRFYEDPANKKIWVSEAYTVALKMIRGYSEVKLQEEIEFLRRKSQ
jgi:hypothetical protein